jgi:hypothetical protein
MKLSGFSDSSISAPAARSALPPIPATQHHGILRLHPGMIPGDPFSSGSSMRSLSLASWFPRHAMRVFVSRFSASGNYS